MDHVFDQRPTVAHGNRAIELTAALHRIDGASDVGSVHAVQDADLAGHAVHRQPHALDVAGDRARRQVSFATDRETMIDLGAFSMEFGQRNPSVAADDRVVVEMTFVEIDAGMAGGEGKNVVAHRLGSEMDGLARHHRAGAGEGAGVVGRAVGIGVDDVDVAGAHADDGGGNLLMRRGDAVAHFG